MNKKMGVDVAQIMEDSAEDTFVKILNGTNIFEMKEKGSDDDLMSSDFDMQDGERMQSAIVDGSMQKNP